MDRTLIIAEAGVNHNGDLNLAFRLVEAAAEAGADFVKFQTFKAEKLVTPTAAKADYQTLNTGDDNTQFSMLKQLELDDNMHRAIIQRCKECGIAFLSTPFDEESIDYLDSLGVPLFKIPSGEITNKPYLQKIASKGKPVILSTGMADIQEISNALVVLEQSGINRQMITVLHCNTEYPTPMEDVNLRAMLHIQQELGVAVGYSDHTLGIEVSIAAVSLGARVIEKHFTIDRQLPGPDHAASLEPGELKAMVKAIRNIELAMSGSGKKEPSLSELKNKNVVRKSMYYMSDLTRGHILENKDIIFLRPASGMSPMEIDNVVGKMLVNDVKKGTPVNINDLKQI